jgi:hypothetical protein
MRISKKEYDELVQVTQAFQRVNYEFAMIREIMTRLVADKGAISFDFLDECPQGLLKWNTVETPAGSREMTIWFEPGEFTPKDGRLVEALTLSNAERQ